MADKKPARKPVDYRVKEKSLIGNEIHEAGAVVAYDGLPAENLEPMCDVGRARYQEYLDSNKTRAANMMNQYSESQVGDMDSFAKAWAKAQADYADTMAETIADAIREGIAAGIALVHGSQAKEVKTEIIPA